ncbi:MAG: hypothetical protein RLZZ540_796 [Bacteroidota bacterium]|jgi:hypothetical protein
MRLKRMTSGNIFKIIDENEVRYFQYFYTDQNYLGGDLIWVFKQKTETKNLSEIIDSGYNFCFYTTIDAGVKLKKWQLIGNIEIPIKMQYYSEFRWRDIKNGDWYIIKYDGKINVGKNLNEEQSKVQPVSFQFPYGAVEYMILSKKEFLKRIKDSEDKYYEVNGNKL